MATTSPNYGSMAYEVERTMRTLFKRCVQCPDTQPSCPSCKSGQICSLVPQDCNTCAHMTCIDDPSAAPSSPGPNVGAIAGGVIGGVAVVAIAVFFLWRFWIKKRRAQQELEAEEWEEEEEGTEAKEGGSAERQSHRLRSMRSDADSTRTRGSLANSIISRASNIIQIAYIPGVTNRNGSGRNSVYSSDAPVPPIPAAQRGQPPKSPLSNEGDALFFRPGDLRDSTWSATSSLRSGSNRDTQYTRQSITPSLARSSMASDVYRDDATEMPMPAQTVTRAAPRMVSVKSNNSSNSSPNETSGSKTPVDAAGEHSQFAANTLAGKGSKGGLQVMMPGQGSRPSTSGSQGSQYGKAKQITVGGQKNLTGGARPFGKQASDASLTPSMASSKRHAPAVSSPLAEVPDEDDEGDHTPAKDTGAGSTPPLIQPVESPFFDATEKPSTAAAQPRVNPYATMGSSIAGSGRVGNARGVNALSDIIEEATKRASRVPSHDGLGGKRDQSPFGDQHATE
ncbi:hypothetical protein KC363_g9041 [Hortaea werneckii]|nr:hypothetical protein KC361_g9375 [Hortaea werneckii]KAI6883275.1 hypothetical protein KC325_g5183 [Hortaea werneckii]KAI6985346.1 hypothetical protein KC359_g9172 [Hortaea werneckii]KAI7139840.1 hypothetical protein KC344_g9110 [Hortaea werneckii]KAI7166601.1 hypothetical protein KC360_g9094 [Hortaea werneckii]